MLIKIFAFINKMNLKCSKCLFLKESIDFHRNKSTKTGYSNQCKQCINSKIKCICDKYVLQNYLQKHLLTKMHLKHLNFKNSNKNNKNS